MTILYTHFLCTYLTGLENICTCLLLCLLSQTLECSFVVVRQVEIVLGLSCRVESYHSFEPNTKAVVQPPIPEAVQKNTLCNIYSSLDKS